MLFVSEVKFLQNFLKKCNIQSMVINSNNLVDKRFDYGIRELFGDVKEYKDLFYKFIEKVENNTVYQVSDRFRCNYIFMHLPYTDNESILSIGPFLSEKVEKETILEWSEKYHLNQDDIKQLKLFYGSLTLLENNSLVYSVIDTFAEAIFGKNNFMIKNLNENKTFSEPNFISKNSDDKCQNLLNMQIMESRYAFENDLMQAVAQGQEHKAELILSGITKVTFENRLSDPVRNAKNYCIIMNTLLRKAAQDGGVHPVYLDDTSSMFAKKIETLTSLYAVHGLMIEMFKTYCKLVNKHSLKDYSLPVQKAIICIDSDLTADLTLSAIAEIQNISPGYLSAIFKKETGKTLTDFVTSKRVDYAKKLLKTTNLQIQTVASYCGIPDFQYFSKTFKKHTGMTPKTYRDSK